MREAGVEQSAALTALRAFGHARLRATRRGTRSGFVARGWLRRPAPEPARTVGSFSSMACASISASNAWSGRCCRDTSSVPPAGGLISQVRRGPPDTQQAFGTPVSGAGAARPGCAAGETSDGAAASAPAASAPRTASSTRRRRARGRAAARRPSAGRPPSGRAVLIPVQSRRSRRASSPCSRSCLSATSAEAAGLGPAARGSDRAAR